MTDYEFDNQVISLMAALWPKRTGELNSEQTLIWRNTLRRFRVGEVIIGIRTHAEQGKFFPAPCEVSKICRGNKPDDASGPRNRVDHDGMEKLRLEIAQEAAEDAVTLSTVSVAEFAWHLEECVRVSPPGFSGKPVLSHILGSDRSNRMAQVFVCDSIEAGRVAPQHERTD